MKKIISFLNDNLFGPDMGKTEKIITFVIVFFAFSGAIGSIIYPHLISSIYGGVNGLLILVYWVISVKFLHKLKLYMKIHKVDQGLIKAMEELSEVKDIMIRLQRERASRHRKENEMLRDQVIQLEKMITDAIRQ